MTAYRRSMFEVVMVWLASISTAMICVAIVWFTATIWWHYEPVTKLEIRVLGAPRVGGLMFVEVDYCKPVEAMPVEVRWTLINDITILLEDDVTSLPAGCHVTQRIFELSPFIPASRYRLQVQGIYQPWPWRTVNYLRRSPSFDIAP